jgi:hypothetical protein
MICGAKHLVPLLNQNKMVFLPLTAHTADVEDSVSGLFPQAFAEFNFNYGDLEAVVVELAAKAVACQAQMEPTLCKSLMLRPGILFAGAMLVHTAVMVMVLISQVAEMVTVLTCAIVTVRHKQATVFTHGKLLHHRRAVTGV